MKNLAVVKEEELQNFYQIISTNIKMLRKKNNKPQLDLVLEMGLKSTSFYSKCEKETYTVKLFFLIADLHAKLNEEEWVLAKKLINDLPGEYTKKVLFIKKLEEIGYFRNILQCNDYQCIVKDEKTKNSMHKYIYILNTSYPRKDDKYSLFAYAMDTNLADKDLQSGLNHMMKMNKTELENHKFTDMEKIEDIFEKVEYASNSIDVVIAATATATYVQSGGTSGIAAAKFIAVKKAVIYTAKKFFKKIFSKSVKSKITSSTVKMVKGYALKNFSKSHTKNGIKTGIKALNGADMLGDIEPIGSSIYLYFEPTNIEAKTICKEEK